MSTQHHQLFSSESVSPGHPDKVADQISDAVLDAILLQDKHARVACETLVKNNTIVLAGEISTTAHVIVDEVVKSVIADIGYHHTEDGLDVEQCSVINMLTAQSGDIAQGVNKDKKEAQGAGDQGLMFGFATHETEALMPMPYTLANQLMQRQNKLFKQGVIPWLKPDAKAQVAGVYEKDKMIGIHNVVLSTQHTHSVSLDILRKTVLEEIILPVLPSHLVTEETKFYINPTGQFILGGPHADCGLTGRKIIVDTYGGMARHGGGCFSGKDASKVDRSAAYMARYIAKHIVSAKFAKKCEVQLAYAIGRSQPTSVRVDTFGTSDIPEYDLEKMVQAVFPLTPYGIIEHLDLLRPIYRKTATFGHFGRSEFSWEQLNNLDAVRQAIK